MVTSVVWQRSGKAARNLTLTMTKMRMKMNMSLTTATFEVTDLEMKATSEVGALMEMEEGVPGHSMQEGIGTRHAQRLSLSADDY